MVWVLITGSLPLNLQTMHTVAQILKKKTTFTLGYIKKQSYLSLERLRTRENFFLNNLINFSFVLITTRVFKIYWAINTILCSSHCSYKKQCYYYDLNQLMDEDSNVGKLKRNVKISCIVNILHWKNFTLIHSD